MAALSITLEFHFFLTNSYAVKVTGRKSQDGIGRCEVLHKITLVRKTPRHFRSGELIGSTFRFFDIRPLFFRHEFFGRFQ